MQKLQEATLLPLLEVASKERNGSTASEGNSDSMDMTPDTTPPKNNPKESTFPPFEYASYSILCNSGNPSSSVRSHCWADIGRGSHHAISTSLTHIAPEERNSPTACKGSSDSMGMTPDASPPGNMVEEFPLPEHEGASHNNVISNHKDHTASNHEAPEDFTLSEL